MSAASSADKTEGMTSPPGLVPSLCDLRIATSPGPSGAGTSTTHAPRNLPRRLSSSTNASQTVTFWSPEVSAGAWGRRRALRVLVVLVPVVWPIRFNPFFKLLDDLAGGLAVTGKNTLRSAVAAEVRHVVAGRQVDDECAFVLHAEEWFPFARSATIEHFQDNDGVFFGLGESDNLGVADPLHEITYGVSPRLAGFGEPLSGRLSANEDGDTILSRTGRLTRSQADW